MNEIPTPAAAPTEKQIPRTAADALALWQAGEPVPAFEVESEGAPQRLIYAAAFEIILSQLGGAAFTTPLGLTKREIEAAESIAAVALAKGWAPMLKQHRHESIAEIIVQKPKSVASD